MIGLADLHLACRVTGTANDDYLTLLEASAVAYAQRRLGFYIGEAQEVTQYVDGPGTNRLWLADEPLAAVTVIERPVPGADGTEIVEGSTSGFERRGLKLVRLNGLAWVRGYEYAVTYDRGYDSLDDPSPSRQPPADLQNIVRTLVVHWFERRVPVPKIGEVHTFPVPHHLESLIQAIRRPVV